MANGLELLDYREVAERIAEGRNHLLLGNGFSIACDPVFAYGSLYEAAVGAGLSPRAQLVFDRLGTNNFEGAMRLLDDGHWLSHTYGLVPGPRSAMLDDLDIIKDTLVHAIANSHLEHSGSVSDERKLRAAQFLAPYHNVFCTNYDLLAYWVDMAAGNPPPYEDGFRLDQDEPDDPTPIFSEHLGDKKGLFFVHGALHLFLKRGAVRKHSWIGEGRPLIELIREGLTAGQYPLFVAEGNYVRKLEQIRRNGYLSYCLAKLGRVKNRLVIFGHSLSQSDLHIADAIASNTEIRELYVGIHGDPDDASALATRHSVDYMVQRRQERAYRRRERDLRVVYYRSGTAVVWDAHPRPA